MGLNCRLGGELFKGERTKVSLALQYEQRRNSEGQYKWALGAFTDINPNKSEIAKKKDLQRKEKVGVPRPYSDKFWKGTRNSVSGKDYL